jgi:thiol-disulfide isomerase/thioredoxin
MILRKILLTLLGLTAFCAAYCQQVNFTIKGRLNNKSAADKIILQGGSINTEIKLTPNNEFFYQGSLPSPDNLFIKTNHSGAWTIWVTNGEIDLTLEEYYLDGITVPLLRINALTGPLETEKRKWLDDCFKKTISQFKSLPKQQFKDSMAKYFYPYLETYLTEHPNDKFSASLIQLFSLDNERKALLLSLINRGADEEVASHIENALKRDTLLRVGKKIEVFAQPTLKGQHFSLGSLSSKYTLLEFWASDCLPCRKDNPALIELYTQYHNKGFEIVGISLDREKGEWEKAVIKDKLPWTNVSDLQGWNNKLALKYFIDRIPFNVLIDQNRNIVAVDLRAHTLSDKLRELLEN